MRKQVKSDYPQNYRDSWRLTNSRVEDASFLGQKASIGAIKR